MILSSDILKSQLRERAARVEAFLSTSLDQSPIPERLSASMRYSLLAGGKRLRPVLCLSVARMFGMAEAQVMPFAASIEMIHTYSLIHDDLPAMDDDDLRRGKPSNHKQFDEATAILAGDALLTDAFSFMARTGMSGTTPLPAMHVLAAIQEMAHAAGSFGMVGGQALDMEYTGRSDISLKPLQTMHTLKTGALLRASCVTGAFLGGASSEDVERIRIFGASIGSAFQIVDDILDEIGNEAELGKPVGSDRAQGKVTYPSLLGIEQSRVLAQQQVDAAITAISSFEGDEALFLRSLAQYIVDRVS